MSELPEWMRPGWYDVTDPEFGAIGDGETDDAAAIQHAIDVCAAHGGGTVFLPPATYIVGASLQVTT